MSGHTADGPYIQAEVERRMRALADELEQRVSRHLARLPARGVGSLLYTADLAAAEALQEVVEAIRKSGERDHE